MKAILCYHHSYPKRIRPAPAIVIGQCKHNYSCPVCGSGRGQYPDPCAEGAEMSAISIEFKCDNCEMRCRLVIHYLPTSDNKVGYTCPEDIGGCGKHFEHDILHRESDVACAECPETRDLLHT